MVDDIIKRINALLNMTVENGATEAEAITALNMAQSLMTKHMIDSTQLAEHAKDKKCVKVEVDMFKTAYDTDALNGAIAGAFDCKCWWNRHKKKVWFFGYGEDAKLAAYFYSYLNNAIVNEAEKYKKSLDFVEQKIYGYHGKTIMASFRKGMISRIMDRLKKLKESRTSNVIDSTGTDLVVIKDNKVNEEYISLNLNLTTKKSNLTPENIDAWCDGLKKADALNMAGGIQHEEVKAVKA